jgi:hypothetical protein
LRSAYFTVTLAELGSAAEAALKLEASVPKIAVAIRPRRPAEGVEVFIVVSWIVDEKRLDLHGRGRGRWEAVYIGPLRFSQLGFQAPQKRYAPRSGSAWKWAQGWWTWVKTGEARRFLTTGATNVGRVKGGSPGAVRVRDSGLEYLETDPLSDPLRNEPRFEAIEPELKFPTDWAATPMIASQTGAGG